MKDGKLKAEIQRLIAAGMSDWEIACALDVPYGLSEHVRYEDYDYYYLDNWTRAHHYFKTLAEAEAAAKTEDGYSITIYNRADSAFSEHVEAAGLCYN